VPVPKVAGNPRRAQILRAVYAVAARVGLNRLTVRLVAAKARLSAGLVLFYFKTKERLLRALLRDVLRSAEMPAIPKEVARLKSPVARLRSLLQSEIKRLLSEPDRVRLLAEYRVKGFGDSATKTKMRGELEHYRDAFLPTAKAVIAQEPGRFPNVSAEGLAAVAVGVIEGCAVQSVIDPGNFDADQYLAAAKGLLA
jgi:TetR/AcrR family transcriptional repressor of bet genes